MQLFPRLSTIFERPDGGSTAREWMPFAPESAGCLCSIRAPLKSSGLRRLRPSPLNRYQMVIDTSALIAISLGEPSSQVLLVSLLEAGIVIRARLGAGAVFVFYQLVEELGVDVVPFDGPQARAAIAAFGRFGKGMGHPGQLNFGDCAVNALAEFRGDPVLAMDNDFAATDLIVAGGP